MKKKLSLYVLGVLLIILMAYGISNAGQTVVTLTIPGMTWGGTAHSVSSALKAIAGVIDIKTDTDKHTAEVTYDSDKANVDKMKKALLDVGFVVK